MKRPRGRPPSAVASEVAALMRRLAKDQVRRVGIAAWTPTIGQPVTPTRRGQSVASQITKIADLMGQMPRASAALTWRGVVVGLGYHVHRVRAPWSVRPVQAWAPRLLSGEQAQACFERLLPAVQRPLQPRPEGLELDRRWEEVRAIVRGRFGQWMRRNNIDIEDAEQVVYLGLITRQEGRSAYDPARSGWARYVTLVAGSVLSHLVERTVRNAGRERAWDHEAEDLLMGRVTDSPESALIEYMDDGKDEEGKDDD